MNTILHKNLVFRFALVLVPCLLLLSSCEKVIDVNLNSAEKKYVIEAVLTDQPDNSYVLISQTKDFDQDNNFPRISGATVTITEVGGATTTLPESATPGRYQAAGLAGVSGKSYTLKVTISGQQYTAVSTMPAKVPLDTIYATDELLFDDYNKTINVEHTDPPGLGNSYRYIQYRNGTKEKEIYILNDEYTNGRYINSKLFNFDDDDEDDDGIKSGDNIRVDMLCIDPVVYKYWFSLIRSSTGSSGQATPANPVSNMQGGALGYFSAHTLQTKTMVVP